MNKSTLLIAVLMLGIGIGTGYWLSGNSSSTVAVTEQDKKPLFYRDPDEPEHYIAGTSKRLHGYGLHTCLCG